ncbi:MAG: protein kinase domain-containing protein [Blastocatellia bacterium]
MNRYHRAKELFQAALDHDQGERMTFLADACAGDAELQQEVEQLIAHHNEAASFIESPAVEAVLKALQGNRSPSLAGQHIGPYKIIREIGRGGMGAVYLATRADDTFKKRVAIKLIKRGMDTEDILRRFRNERQILASLNHPNIARLVDGGTTEDGLPYFVMEYIEGLSLLDYCDGARLSTVERLHLFRKICAAVQHAHQNLIVHRDLKPSNILVTSDGEPKLLDFGIAKFLNPEMSPQTIAPTMTAMRLMTRDYASPEQVRGFPITTASDVYSLGVLLYKLLTGHHPYQFRTPLPSEVERIICETEPQRPSDAISRIEEVEMADGTSAIIRPETVSIARNSQPAKLRRVLSGDLDNIILMAMRKEPVRRYSSVEQFSEDTRRHLEGLPVIARKDTFAYRTSKFVHRHKAGAAAALLVLLTLMAGVIATLWEAHIAHVQRMKAEQRFNDVRRLANSFLFEIHDSVQNLAGSTPTRQLLVTRALEYLDSLARESGDDPTLQTELATAYDRVGDIQGNPYTQNLGDTEGAMSSYHKALAIRESLSHSAPGKELQLGFGLSYRAIADILEQKGDLAGCIENYRRSLETFEQLADANPDDVGVRDEYARAYECLGDGLTRTTDLNSTMNCYRKALAIREDMLNRDPANIRMRLSVATCSMKLGGGWVLDRTEGLNSYRRSIALLEAMTTADPTNARAWRTLAMAQFYYGEALTATGDYNSALDALNKALAIRVDLSAKDPTNKQALFDLAGVQADLSEALSKSGQAERGKEIGEKALAEFQSLVSLDPSNMVFLRNFGLCQSIVALAHATLAADSKAAGGVRSQQWAEARDLYQKALEVFSDLQKRNALRPTDSNRAAELAGKVKQCNEAMQRLRTPDSLKPSVR